jgi:hypothetical protein
LNNLFLQLFQAAQACILFDLLPVGFSAFSQRVAITVWNTSTVNLLKAYLLANLSTYGIIPSPI